MRPHEVKDYSESYQFLWANRMDYQEFRFQVMNMWVDEKYDSTTKESDNEKAS